jgi:hypothetical protein
LSAAAPPSPAPEGDPAPTAVHAGPASPASPARVVAAQPPPRWLSPALTVAVGALLGGLALYGGGGQSLSPKTVTEIVLLLGGGALVIVALLLAPPGTRATGALTVGLLAALAVLTAVSIAWAVNPADAWLLANRHFAYAALFAGVVALARILPDRWAAILGGIVLATAGVSLYALATKALPDLLNENELFARLREPFGYWNAVGLTGALAVPACLWLGARREGPPLVNALAYPAVAAALAATLLAYSRGSLLAAAIGCAVWFWLAPLRLRGATVLLLGGGAGVMIAVWAFGQDALTTDRAPLDDRATAGAELLVLMLAVLLIAYVAGLAAGFAADAKPLRHVSRRRAGTLLLVGLALTPAIAAGALSMTDAGLTGSIDNAWDSVTDTSAVGPANDPSRLTATGSVRSRYWDEAFQMWETEPLTGVGGGGYATARPRYRQDLLDVRHAHGYVPETMAELGLLGMAISLALLAAWIVAARSTIRATRGPERAGIVTLTAIAVTFGAHAFIDWTWSIPGTAAVGLVAAAWVAGRGIGDGRPRLALSRDPRRAIAVAVVAVLALTAAWTAWQPLRARGKSDDALTAFEARDFKTAEARAEEARDINPLSIDPLFDLAAIEQAAGDQQGAEAALVLATELQPENWLPWMRLTDFRLFVKNDPEGAMNAVRTAIYLNPRSWDVSQRYLDVRRRLRGS